MAVTEVSICNMALSRIGGANTIVALTDNTEEARQCNLHYEPTRDALLRAHPWNFAIRRIYLINQSESNKTITGITNANPAVVTAVAHGYSDGERVRIEDVAGMTELNDGTFVINVLTTDTFRLRNTDSTDYGTYTSGGTSRKIPAFDFDYWFDLPTDCLRVLSVDDRSEIPKTEFNRLLYDSDEAQLTYVYKATDPTLFDTQFVDLLSAAIAVKVSMKLSDNANLKESLKQDFAALLRDARTFSSMEHGTPSGIDADLWTYARL